METEYKSDWYQLARSFEKSRDKWKEKAKNTRLENKNINHKLNYHQNRTIQLTAENKELMLKLRKLEAELGLKKTKDSVQPTVSKLK